MTKKVNCINCGKEFDVPDHALDPIPADPEHDEPEQVSTNFVCGHKCSKEHVDKVLKENDLDDKTNN